MAAGLSGCRRATPDCAYDSVERCLWEQGRASPDDPVGVSLGEHGGDLDDTGVAERANWGQVDVMLAELVNAMGPGLEWALVDARARALCSDPEHPTLEAESNPDASPAPEDPDGDEPGPRPGSKPGPRPGPKPDPGVEADPGVAWACWPATPIPILERNFSLETGGGVLALSTTHIAERESAEILAFALERFDSWCEGGSFERTDSRINHEVYRCALPEGPYLLVGRFPNDLEAELWQISIAVMDAG